MSEPITTEETYHVSNILKHYAHAKEKHPYFCDWPTIHPLSIHLDRMRAHLSEQVSCGDVDSYAILECELAEAQDALNERDTAHAVEECYDAIAVLLRTIDVLKGRQKLGKPETKGDNK